MSRVRTYAYRTFDAVVYGVAATAIAFVLLTVLSFATDNGWTGVKAGLFLLGLGYGVVATWKLRPEPAHERYGSDGSDGSDEESESRIPDISMGSGLGLGGGSGFGSTDDGSEDSGIVSEQLSSESMSDRESGLAGLLYSIPPLSLAPFAPGERAGDGLRFLLTSGIMFVLSFVMEAVFRVGYPNGPS